MPSQDLTVRVRVQGMGKYASEFQRGATATRQLSTAGEKIQQVGGRISSIGDNLTKSVTLPIVAVGAAAMKMSMDFDNAFTQMQTLAGVSAGEVDGLKESVLDLAGETGRAPQELAEALYFLQSSGLSAKGAMDALEISAKASAAGLGETQVLADAVSSAMLGYAEAGLTASAAMDTLVATAQEGKAEPAEIAAQMGKLIPVASALGITFQDVGGALAALSTKGFDAAQGSTVLAAVMSKLQKPSQQAEEALEAVGLSTSRVKDLLAEKGLLGTLLVLKERLGDNGFTKFLEDQEAVRGGIALTTGDMEKIREIFDEVEDSAGKTDKAFQIWAENMGSDNAKAFAKLQVAMIQFGDVIAPIASTVLSFLTDVIGGFSELPGPVQKAVVAFLAILAAVGPLMSVGGRLISVWGSVVKVFDNLTSAGGQAFAGAMNAGTEATNNLSRKMSGLQAAAGMAAGAAGIGAVLFAIHEMGRAAHEAEIEKLTEDFMEGADMADLFADALDGDAFTMSKVNEILGDLIDTNLEAAERFVDAAEAAGVEEEAIAAARQAIDDKRSADAQAASDAGANQEAIEGTTEALADEEQAVNEAAEAYKNYAATIQGVIDPVFGLLNALRGNQEAQRGVIEAQAKLDEVMADSESTTADVAAAQRDLQDAILGVGDSALDVTTSAAALNAAVAENPALVDSALDALQTWRDQGIIPTDAQLRFLQEQIKQTALQGVALGGVDPSVDVTTTGTRTARERFADVEHAAERIPSSRNTSVNATGTTHAKGLVDQLRESLDRLHDRRVNVNVVVSTSGALDALSGSRARGGPVGAGRLYEVGEHGRAELLRMGGRSYLIPGSDGYVDPALSGAMAMGGSPGGPGGGGDTFVFNVGVVGSQREFDRMVQRAFNVRKRKGRGVNAAA